MCENSWFSIFLFSFLTFFQSLYLLSSWFSSSIAHLSSSPFFFHLKASNIHHPLAHTQSALRAGPSRVNLQSGQNMRKSGAATVSINHSAQVNPGKSSDPRLIYLLNPIQSWRKDGDEGALDSVTRETWTLRNLRHGSSRHDSDMVISDSNNRVRTENLEENLNISHITKLKPQWKDLKDIYIQIYTQET